MDQNITLMSYNTRINSHRDGEYQLYPYRISYVIEFLRDCGADVIGLQEVQTLSYRQPFRSVRHCRYGQKCRLRGGGLLYPLQKG